jgi:hypothetical protein
MEAFGFHNERESLSIFQRRDGFTPLMDRPGESIKGDPALERDRGMEASGSHLKHESV